MPFTYPSQSAEQQAALRHHLEAIHASAVEAVNRHSGGSGSDTSTSERTTPGSSCGTPISPRVPGSSDGSSHVLAGGSREFLPSTTATNAAAVENALSARRTRPRLLLRLELQ